MISKEYSEAFVEILDILEHTEKSAVNKIPNQLIEFFRENASKTYTVNLEHNQEIAAMNLKKETLSLLAMIYRNYWCTKEERDAYDKMLNENEAKYQAELYEKYNPDNLFKKPQTENFEAPIDNLPIEVKPESFYQKLVNFLKKFFKRK